jgi:hypothetical protein
MSMSPHVTMFPKLCPLKKDPNVTEPIERVPAGPVVPVSKVMSDDPVNTVEAPSICTTAA